MGSGSKDQEQITCLTAKVNSTSILWLGLSPRGGSKWSRVRTREEAEDVAGIGDKGLESIFSVL